MKFINTFKEGDRGTEVYLVQSKKAGINKNGKPFESVTLRDKTGTIDGKIWDVDSDGISDYDEGDYVAVTGEITSWNGMLQFKINRLRKANENEYEPANYIPSSSKDIGEMYDELLGLIDSVSASYMKGLLNKFFRNDEKFVNAFKNHSAAKSVHHGFVGGLLEHTLSVTKNCDFFAGNYPFLDRDLLLTAAMLHDIGKITELSDFPKNDYTDQGQMLGHIVIGYGMVRDAIMEIADFPETKATELLHCIVSHHGELEYGSPKKPAIAEAICLSFADNIDAKMETIHEALANTEEDNLTWLGVNKFLDSNIRHTSKK